MDAAAIITAVSGLGPLVTSLGKVVGHVVKRRKADEPEIRALEEAIDSLQHSLVSVRTLADALQDYYDLTLDVANVTGLCARLHDYVQRFQSELRQGEATPAWEPVDLLMGSLDETKSNAFTKLQNKMDQEQLDPQDSGRLKELVRNFDESHAKAVGFVEARVLATLIGQLTNMREHSGRMQRRLGRTSHRLIGALRRLEQ